jgi:hypothetical protein
MWHSSAMRDRIVIGKHSLSCNEDNKVLMYRDDWSGRFDGIHLYGSQGKKAYSASVLNILRNVLPITPPSSPASSSHSMCPQSKYQKKKYQTKKSAPRFSSSQSSYTIPLNNKFDVLGN